MILLLQVLGMHASLERHVRSSMISAEMFDIYCYPTRYPTSILNDIINN